MFILYLCKSLVELRHQRKICVDLVANPFLFCRSVSYPGVIPPGAWALVPTKKSIRIEIVAFMESRSVTFPNHAFLPSRLLAIQGRSAGRDSRPPSSAIDLRAFPPRS